MSNAGDVLGRAVVSTRGACSVMLLAGTSWEHGTSLGTADTAASC
jgi:hypothetical protein